MKQKVMLLAVLTNVFFSSMLMAANLAWDPNGVDFDFGNKWNWIDKSTEERGFVPSTADYMWIRSTGTISLNHDNSPVINAGETFATKDVFLYAGGELTIQEGATLDLANNVLKIGRYASGSKFGTVNNSGDILCSNMCYIGQDGNGCLNMLNGSWTNAWRIQIPQDGKTVTGLVQLDGGVFGARNMVTVNPTGHIDITEGTLKVANNWVDLFNGYIQENLITAYADRTDPNYPFYEDETAGIVHVGGNSRASLLVEYKDGYTYVTAQVPDMNVAWEPSPANGASAVDADVTLSWNAGEGITSHNIFFGESEEMMAPLAFGYTETSIVVDMPISLGKTYYWHVDEVGADGMPVIGQTWSFTVADHLTVDDFDAYADTADLDWSANAKAAIALETATVKHGDKSLKFDYDNSAAGTSEICYTYDGAADWTNESCKAFVFAFRGPETNASDRLYTFIEDNAGNVSDVIYYDETFDGKTDDLSLEDWQSWKFFDVDYAQYGDAVDLTNVKKVYIGVGDKAAPAASGTGTLYIDSIRLYPARCLGQKYIPLNLAGECDINTEDLELFMKHWLLDVETTIEAAPVAKAPVLWYGFENAADLAADTAGVYNGEVANGTPVQIDGPAGKAADLADGSEINIPTTVMAGINDEMTISFWQNLASDIDMSDRMIFWTREADPKKDMYIFAPTISGQVKFSVGYEGISWTPDTSSVWKGGWNHYAFVIRPGFMAAYCNGELVSANYSPEYDLAAFQNADEMALGGRFSGYSQYSYYGSVDEFQIYDYALAQSEVLTLAGKQSTAGVLLASSDFNKDGQVDIEDFAKLAKVWLETLTWPEY